MQIALPRRHSPMIWVIARRRSYLAIQASGRPSGGHKSCCRYTAWCRVPAQTRARCARGHLPDLPGAMPAMHRPPDACSLGCNLAVVVVALSCTACAQALKARLQWRLRLCRRAAQTKTRSYCFSRRRTRTTTSSRCRSSAPSTPASTAVPHCYAVSTSWAACKTIVRRFVTCLPAEVLLCCREPEVEPLQPPAKRPCLHSRTDTTELKATVDQGMLQGVVIYLRGGILKTLAVQVTLRN